MATGDVGDASVVLHDQFNLLAGDHIAVELHVETGASDFLAAGSGLRAGKRSDQADFHGLLRQGRRGELESGGKAHGPRKDAFENHFPSY